VILLSRLSRIIYKINEGNANNPANLLVGQEITIHDGKKEISGVLELITNEYVIVRDDHTQVSYSFKDNGFNKDENAIEFVRIDDENMKFYA
jgi:hypothetical protein